MLNDCHFIWGYITGQGLYPLYLKIIERVNSGKRSDELIEGISSSTYCLLSAIIANAPDIDVLALLLGEKGHSLHRTFTHSIPMCIGIFGPLLALPVRSILGGSKHIPYSHSYLLTVSALLSHLATDWITNYGTALFWPFDGTFYTLGVITVTDLSTLLLTYSSWIYISSSSTSSTFRSTLFNRLWSSLRRRRNNNNNNNNNINNNHNSNSSSSSSSSRDTIIHSPTYRQRYLMSISDSKRARLCLVALVTWMVLRRWALLNAWSSLSIHPNGFRPSNFIWLQPSNLWPTVYHEFKLPSASHLTISPTSTSTSSTNNIIQGIVHLRSSSLSSMISSGLLSFPKFLTCMLFNVPLAASRSFTNSKIGYALAPPSGYLPAVRSTGSLFETGPRRTLFLETLPSILLFGLFHSNNFRVNLWKVLSILSRSNLSPKSKLIEISHLLFTPSSSYS